MSYIAPGKWNPLDRMFARYTSWLVGVFLLVVAYKFGVPLIDALKEGREFSVWWALVPLVPLALGCAALVPNVFMPLMIRVIDKFLTDKPKP